MAWWFVFVLAVLGFAAGASALVLSLRTRRTARRPPAPAPPPAREPPFALRPRTPTRLQDQVDQIEEGLARQDRRVADLEMRLAAVISGVRHGHASGPVATPAGTAEAPFGAEARVREHLVARGYEDPILLERPGPARAWTVETRRKGLWTKGVARILDDGRLEVRLDPVTRVFP